MEDVVPPAIWLVGPERVEVLQLTTYVDEGTEAVDDADDAVEVLVQGLDSIDTSVPTETGSRGYLVVYTAVDAAGNSATVTREVVVISRCVAPETWCFDFGSCSVLGKCFPAEIADLFSEEQGAVTEPVPPAADELPPVLELLGSCAAPGCHRTLTASGQQLWRYKVELGGEFVDGGVRALDDVDGDLSAAVSTKFERGATVDTWIPTTFDNGYLITYSVKDASGNEAEPVNRVVDVHCPGNEVVCTEGRDPIEYTCSSAGMCSVILPAIGAELAAGGRNEVAAVVLAPVLMSLRGPAAVQVPQGSPYIECPPNTPPGRVCDRGATATNSIDGNLDKRIEVCSDGLGPGEGFLYDTNGIMPCQIDTSVPGIYTVDFRVQDSGNPPNTASVSRVVVVEAVNDCTTLGELCDQESPSDVLFQDMPPVLTLLGSHFVEVKQGTEYKACAPGQEPLSSSPCDLGARAEDNEDGDLTNQVIVLSEDHRALDCLLEDCLAQRFIARGLNGCGVDTSADPGTVFDVQFFVYDQAGNWDAVNRTITIKSPCSTGQFLCGGVCSEVDCDTRALFVSTATEAVDIAGPEITLRQGGGEGDEVVGQDSSLYIDYRALLGSSIVPCTSAAGEHACGATASDDVDGDVSSSLSVEELSGCSPGSPDCFSCSPAMLGAGYPWCIPGHYQYEYRASDSSGNEATPVTRSVCIGSRGRVEAVVRLNLLGAAQGSLSAASALAEQSLELGSGLNLHLRAAVAEAIPGCQAPGSIVVFKAATVSDPVKGWGLELVFRISVTYPCGDTSAHCTNDESVLRQVSRRLLQDDETITIQDSLLYTVDGTWTGLSSASFSSALLGVNMTFQEVEETSSVVETFDVDVIGGKIASVTGQLAALDTGMLLDLQLPMATVETETRNSFLGDSSSGDYMSWSGLWLTKVTEAMLAADAVLSQQDEVEAALNLKASGAAAAGAASISDSSLLAADLAEKAADSQAQTYSTIDTPEFRSFLSGPCPALSSAELANTRQGTYQISFRIDHEASGSVPGGERRHLSSVPEAHEVPGQWGGYTLQRTDPQDRVNTAELSGQRPADRFIGPRPGANRVLGGMMLYLHREGINLTHFCSQPREQRFIHLSSECGLLRLLEHELEGEALEESLRGIADALTPYGSDPVFIKQSSLYRPTLKSRMAEFYNASEDSPDFRNPFVPTGWYPASTPGHEGGFPLVMEISTNQERAKALWQAVADGGFLDKYSQELEVEVMTYSPLSQLLGFSTTSFHWDPQWIGATTECFAIPVIDWNQSKLHFVTTGILAALAVAYSLQTLAGLWKFRCCMRRGHRPKTAKSSMSTFNHALPDVVKGRDPVVILGVVFDALLSTLLMGASAAGLMTALIGSNFTPSPSYEVYDAQISAPARFFMLDRQETPEGVVEGNLTSPGGPGRWELPPNMQGLEDFSSAMVTIRDMRTWSDLKNSLTAVAVLLLLARLLHAWVFQAKLSIAALSIVRILPALGSLAITASIIAAMLAAWGHLLIGGFFGPFSTYSGSLGFLFSLLVMGDLAGGTSENLADGMRPAGFQMQPLDSIMVLFFFIAVIVLLPIMINNFVVTIMLVMWDSTKEAVGEAQTLQEQLQQVLERSKAQLARGKGATKATAKGTRRLIATLLKGMPLRRRDAMLKRLSTILDRDSRIDFLAEALESIAQEPANTAEPPTVAKHVADSWSYLTKTVSGRFENAGTKLNKSISGNHWSVTEVNEAPQQFHALNEAVKYVSERTVSRSESRKSAEYHVCGMPMDPQALAATAITRFGRMDDLIDMIEDEMEKEEAAAEELAMLDFVIHKHKTQLVAAGRHLEAMISSCELLRQNQKVMRRSMDGLVSLNTKTPLPDLGATNQEPLPNAPVSAWSSPGLPPLDIALSSLPDPSSAPQRSPTSANSMRLPVSFESSMRDSLEIHVEEHPPNCPYGGQE